MNTRKVDFEDVTLAYQTLSGEKPGSPLLMIQGLTGVKEDWAQMATLLAEDRPVLVFDNRGMGESSVPDGPYTIEQLANDALRLLDHVGWPRAHVMGISMGGMIAQQLALLASERIDKLVLGCTGHGGHTQVMAEPEVLMAFQTPPAATLRETVRNFMWINYTEAWMAANQETYERHIDESIAYKRSRRGMIHQLGAVMNFDVAEKITNIPHETLIIHGREDRLLPFGNGELLAAKIPRSKLIDLPKAGHVFWRMDDGESAKVVREFLG